MNKKNGIGVRRKILDIKVGDIVIPFTHERMMSWYGSAYDSGYYNSRPEVSKSMKHRLGLPHRVISSGYVLELERVGCKKTLTISADDISKKCENCLVCNRKDDCRYFDSNKKGYGYKIAHVPTKFVEDFKKSNHFDKGVKIVEYTEMFGGCKNWIVLDGEFNDRWWYEYKRNN